MLYMKQEKQDIFWRQYKVTKVGISQQQLKTPFVIKELNTS